MHPPEEDELTERLRYISLLTDKLMAMQQQNAEARELALRIQREIDIARVQLKLEQIDRMSDWFASQGSHRR